MLRGMPVPRWLVRWSFILPALIVGRIAATVHKQAPFETALANDVLAIATGAFGLWLSYLLFRRVWPRRSKIR